MSPREEQQLHFPIVTKNDMVMYIKKKEEIITWNKIMNIKPIVNTEFNDRSVLKSVWQKKAILIEEGTLNMGLISNL